MNKERGEEEPNIVQILDEELKKVSTDPELSVSSIAGEVGVDIFTLAHWADNDKLFKEQLAIIKESYDKDPWKDTPDDSVKLDALVLKHGIRYVLEETKKRYTV